MGRTIIYKYLEITCFFISLVGSPRIKNKSDQDVLFLEYIPGRAALGHLSSFKWGEPSSTNTWKLRVVMPTEGGSEEVRTRNLVPVSRIYT